MPDPTSQRQTSDHADEITARRAQLKRLTRAAKRVGYLCLLVAIVTFALALATGLAGWAVTATVVALVAACVILPIPIVLGYGIRAAEREDRTEQRKERDRRPAP